MIGSGSSSTDSDKGGDNSLRNLRIGSTDSGKGEGYGPKIDSGIFSTHSD